MALPSSGEMSVSQIINEVSCGAQSTGDLSWAVANSNPVVSGGSMPADASEFYSHTQSCVPAWGSLYKQSVLQQVALIYDDAGNFIDAISPGTNESIAWQPNQNSFTKLTDSQGQDFLSGDNIKVTVYYRNKGGSGWNILNSWNNYASQVVSMTFDTYDYKWGFGN